MPNRPAILPPPSGPASRNGEIRTRMRSPSRDSREMCPLPSSPHGRPSTKGRASSTANRSASSSSASNKGPSGHLRTPFTVVSDPGKTNRDRSSTMESPSISRRPRSDRTSNWGSENRADSSSISKRSAFSPSKGDDTLAYDTMALRSSSRRMRIKPPGPDSISIEVSFVASVGVRMTTVPSRISTSRNATSGFLPPPPGPPSPSTSS